MRKILNGSKTVEIRKTEPKCGVPFKCYIYCTAGGKGALMVKANAVAPAITAELACEEAKQAEYRENGAERDRNAYTADAEKRSRSVARLKRMGLLK